MVNTQNLSSGSRVLSFNVKHETKPWPTRPSSSFKFSVFAEEFVVHFLYPFSLPFYAYIRGWSAALNHQFLNPSLAAMFFTNIIPCSLWFTIVWFSFYNDELFMQGIDTVELVTCISFYSIHRLSVAIKYAYLSKEQYNWFINCQNFNEATEFTNKIQLLTGWLYLSDESTIEELEKAQVRMQVQLRDYYFQIIRNATEVSLWEVLFAMEGKFIEQIPCSKSLKNSTCSQLSNMAKQNQNVWSKLTSIRRKIFHKKDLMGNSTSSLDLKTTYKKQDSFTNLNDWQNGTSTYLIPNQENDLLTEKGDTFVDGFTVLHALIRYGVIKQGNPAQIIMPVSWMCSVILGCLGGISRLSCKTLEDEQFVNSTACGHGFFGDDTVGYVFVVNEIFIVATLSVPVISLFLTLLYDLWRRQRTLARFGKLLHYDENIVFQGHTVKTTRKYPTIKLRDPDEIRVWMLCRLVLHDFGWLRLKRMNLYIGIGMIYGFSLVLWFLLIFIRIYDERTSLRTNMVLHFTMVYGTLGTIFVTAAFLAGGDANSAGQLHRKLLVQRKIKLHSDAADDKYCGLVGHQKNPDGLEEAQLLEECESQLDAGAQMVEVLGSVRPYTFLGINATRGVAASIITVIAGVAVFLVQEIFL